MAQSRIDLIGSVRKCRYCDKTFKEKLLKEWVSSGNAPKLEATDLPDTPLIKDYLDQYDSISNKLHDTKSFHDNRDVSTTYLGPGQQNRTDEFQP